MIAFIKKRFVLFKTDIIESIIFYSIIVILLDLSLNFKNEISRPADSFSFYLSKERKVSIKRNEEQIKNISLNKKMFVNCWGY